MKILVVHQGYEMYGSDRMLLNSLESLRVVYNNATIELALPKSGLLSTEVAKLSLVDLISFVPFGVIRKADLKRFNFKIFYHITLGLYNRYRKIRKYDLVYVNSIVILDLLILSCFVKNRMIIHIHEIPDGVVGSVFKFLLRKSKSQLIAVSSEVKNYFSLEKIDVIPNGVTGFEFNEKVVGDSINLLIIGRINHQKGQMFFLNSFVKLNKETRSRYNVRIVGDVFEDQVHFKNEILNIINAHCLEAYVHIFPFSDRPSEHFEWAHIVALPSTKPESFGLVAAEGMSAGCAILGANLGGLKDIIDDQVNGWFYEPNNENDLVAKLQFIGTNDVNIGEIGANGRRKFEMFFSKDAYIERLGNYLKRGLI